MRTDGNYKVDSGWSQIGSVPTGNRCGFVRFSGPAGLPGGVNVVARVNPHHIGVAMPAARGKILRLSPTEREAWSLCPVDRVPRLRERNAATAAMSALSPDTVPTCSNSSAGLAAIRSFA